MTQLKVIFLDIDGVLNVIPEDRDEFGAVFQAPFVDNLKMIIEQTNAKIVISSSWRHSGKSVMLEMWLKRQLPGEVIDITPNFMKVSAIRGEEIADWLHNNWVDAYVILDDDDDMLPEQLRFFVQTAGHGSPSDRNEGYGLTTSRALKAISILNGSNTA